MSTGKRTRIGIWVSIAAIALTVVSLIVYFVGVNASGYFYGNTVSSVLTLSVAEIVLLVVSIVLSLIPFRGVADKIVGLVVDVMRILSAVLLVVALMNLIGSRVEGLAYIFFSDPNILDTIQTPANMTSAGLSIAGFVCYGVAWLVAVIASFFSMNRKKA